MQTDSLLGKAVARSYRYIWIFIASIYFYSLISYITSGLGAASPIIAIITGLAISEILQRTLGAAVWRALEWFIRTSDDPLPARLYFLIDGWAAFITAVLLMVITQSIFNVDIPYAPGPYEYLAGASAIIFVGTLAYATAFRRT